MTGRYKPTFWQILLFTGLLQSGIVSFLHADTLTLPAVAAASIDGSPTAANFALKVEAVSSTARLSTQQLLDLSVAFKPDLANVGQMGSVFAVFVKNDAFFLLRPDRSFTPWNGEVETLLPFLQDVPLTETSSVYLLSGRLSDPGEYQIFTAYATQDEAVLKFTPEPFLLMLTSTAQSPEAEEAAAIYQAQVDSRVVQSRCIVCHVEGGVARNSPLKFQRNMAGAALNNINTLTSYLGRDGNSVETFLNKASGGSAHPGGQQLVRGSQDYQAFERVMRLLEADREQQNQGIVYRFEAGNPPPRPIERSIALLSSVELAPREASLRRASILLAGRVPTADALRAVREGDDNTLREALRALMTGPEFREFVVNAANERLLTRGADEPLNSNFVNFPLLRNLHFDTIMAGRDFWQEYGGSLRDAANRASGELIAHVVINELPYSEILTANYMMMNPLLNQYLGGTATFPPAASAQDFLPSRITQYYFSSEVVRSEERQFFGDMEAGHRVLSTGTPVADYPHAGLLTDFGFLSRYPTTATNRNRARARWTLYHFLGIDIEKSSQRPLDEASLSDRNNPTMNNPNCTVCHAVLDPVAGAFQNWSEWNMYRENGRDTLDHFFKHPNDGSISPYRPGDLWYRDMRLPGLFQTTFSSRDYTLRELANAIVNEPGFMTAAVRFWWPTIFGENLVTLPSVESDQGFAEKSAAYSAQQASVVDFARVLGARGNAKDMLVEMMMSPWFTAQSARHHEFRGVQLEANLGAPRLLGPAQLAAKTLSLTGVNWRSHTNPSGRIWSEYQNISVMLGGIDSVTVLERATLLTPAIFAVQQAIMAEMSCPAVVKDFALPLAKRRMFNLLDETITPLTLASGTFDVTSTAREQWQEIKVSVKVPAEPVSIQVSFTNPYCDYDGVRCVEHRVLYLQGLTLRAAGVAQRFMMNSPEISISGQQCFQQGPEANFNGECTMHFGLHLDTPVDLEIIAHLSAQQAPSRAEPVRAFIEVISKSDILVASTPNARLIKQQIAELIQRFHGRTVSIDSVEVQQVYALFAVGLESARLSGRRSLDVCHTYTDGNFLSDLLTPEQLKLARQPTPDDWWHDDWDYLGPIMREWMNDMTGAKRGWVAVIAYLMTHYDYVHE